MKKISERAIELAKQRTGFEDLYLFDLARALDEYQAEVEYKLIRGHEAELLAKGELA